MDGSHHPWLGDQTPPFTLLIAVDDATVTVGDSLFCEKDWTAGCRGSMRGASLLPRRRHL